MTKDLRYFLKEVEEKQPDDFVTIKKEVDPRFELCGVVRKFQDLGKYPLVYFEKVKGSSFPVASNLFANPSRLALGFGVRESSMLQDYMANEEKKIPSRVVSDGPVKENKLVGDKLDLSKVPHITHSEKDVAPYITSGVSVFKDPDTGAYDTGIFRLQWKENNRFGVLFGDYSKAMSVIRKLRSKGKAN